MGGRAPQVMLTALVAVIIVTAVMLLTSPVDKFGGESGLSSAALALRALRFRGGVAMNNTVGALAHRSGMSGHQAAVELAEAKAALRAMELSNDELRARLEQAEQERGGATYSDLFPQPSQGPGDKDLGSPPEGEVDLAFLIQVHGGTLELMPRLLRAIHHPRNTYAVHFDQGSLVKPELVGVLLRHIKERYDNVFVMNAETITYGGITIVLNALSSMSFLLRMRRRWDYWINLSGNDYPLLAPTAMRQTFARAGGEARLNFVEFNLKHGYPTQPKDLTRQQRFYYGWFDTALVKTKSTVAAKEIAETVHADSICLAQWAWEKTKMNLVCPNNMTIVDIRYAEDSCWGLTLVGGTVAEHP